jgi:integral membrane protein (TIGR01906 family)
MNLSRYMYETTSVNYRRNRILQILFAVTLSLFIISIAVRFTLMFRPLYYFSVQYLEIEEKTGMSREEIVKNYNYVIDYLISPKKQEFSLPSMPYSQYGKIHFKDVKDIFTFFDIMLIVTGIISLLGLYVNIKNKKMDFLRKTSSMLIILPVTLLISFFINFDRAFIIFHKIFFRNEYWQFDPELDPIINILPQEFFYYSALLIVILIIISSAALRLLHRKFKSKKAGA